MNIFYFWTGLMVGIPLGYATCLTLRWMRRMKMEHYLMNLPEPDYKLAETIQCNIANNRKMNAEMRRKEFKIINKGE